MEALRAIWSNCPIAYLLGPDAFFKAQVEDYPEEVAYRDTSNLHMTGLRTYRLLVGVRIRYPRC